MKEILRSPLPAFVVNGTSLEADVPFLALWMAVIALFVRAVDARSAWALAASAAVMALAALAAYQSVALVPVLGAYLLIRRSASFHSFSSSSER